MKLKEFRPLVKEYNPRRIVFITEANTDYLELCDEHGGTTRYDAQNGDAALLNLSDAAIYSLVKHTQLIWFNDARNWKVIKHHGRARRLIYKDTVTIYSWYAFGPDPQAIMPFFDAMDYMSVAPYSLGTMARNSWKNTLRSTGEVVHEWVRDKTHGPVGRRAFIGGRKEALNAPANYEGVHYLDLPAAYVSAMEAILPMFLRESDEPRWCDDGIALATVYVPRQPWNPLPGRITTGQRGTDFLVFGHGTTTEYFVISELRNAVENYGVIARLERVWSGHLYKPVFSRWIEEILPLRQLPGVAGRIVKGMSNQLWSQFGTNPRHLTEVISFADARGREKIIEYQKRPDYAIKTAFLSAIIASRVRVRLLNELTPAGAVYVDTDGGIVPRDVLVPGWEQKRIMDRVEVLASQAYRWCCPECAESHAPWHYSMAGVPTIPWMQEAFWQYFSLKKVMDIEPSSLSIPAMDFNEAAAWLEANK